MVEGLKMQEAVGLTKDQMVSFADISKFEQLLEVKIVVVYRCPETETLARYETTPQLKAKTLFLFFHDQHYYGIVNLKTFLGARYMCKHCYTTYSNKAGHQCEGFCNVCFQDSCVPDPRGKVKCDECHRNCRSHLVMILISLLGPLPLLL